MSKKKILLVAGVTLVYTAMVVFITSIVLDYGLESAARSYVNVAEQLTSSSFSSWRENAAKAGLPPALQSRDHAVVHYLLTAASISDEEDTGALWRLGTFFLTKDCATASHYLARHVEEVGASELTGQILSAAERGDCDSALDLLRRGSE